MLNALSINKDIDTVIIWKLSRLSRNMVDLAFTINHLEKNNVNLISISDSLDTGSSMGKGIVYIARVFAEIERDNILENCHMGMQQRATEGKWNGCISGDNS